MPGDCRAANRVRWRGHRRHLTAEACEQLRAIEVVRAVAEAQDRGGECGEVRGLVVSVLEPPGGELVAEVGAERIGLCWTRHANGGVRRWWFRCPGCGRRAGVLYTPPPGLTRWSCRTCHGLTYRSRQRSNSRKARKWRALEAMAATDPDAAFRSLLPRWMRAKV